MTRYLICRERATAAGLATEPVSLSFTDALTIVAPSQDVALERARRLVADTRGLVAIEEGQ